MMKARTRAAVSPLRRVDIGRLPSVDQAVAELRPDEPMHCLRPAVIASLAHRFVTAFPGEVLYAVKCNPEPTVLRALWRGGVRHFDAASLGEVRLLRQMFAKASIHFMHPVKARGAIRAAYHQYEVRDFTLDAEEELDKIVGETARCDDLGLLVRLALPSCRAVYDLGGKFGAEPAEASRLLRLARPLARRVGLCFHVGSQCLEPAAYAEAIRLAAAVIAAAGVAVEVVDVGGGFPARYAEAAPPPLTAYVAAIAAAAELPAGIRLWCEPGRALTAPGGSLVVRVERRRGGALYINDGVYGSLFDAGAPGFRFPVRLIRPDGGASTAALAPFEFWGPTCDSADRMRGPFLLPADAMEGDWIEIGQLGAYGASLRTGFNGFDRARLIEVGDRPLVEAMGWTED